MTESWMVPTREQVVAALDPLTDPQLRFLFFSRLENPEWLSPLRDLNVFTTSPEVVTDEQGVKRAAPWPEGEYVARIAARVPIAAVQVLVPHVNSRNPWVQRVLLETALVVPEPEARKLVPGVVTFLDLGDDWIDPRQLVQLLQRLSGKASSRARRRLLVAMFRPEAGPEEATAFGPRPSVRTRIGDYFYSEALPAVVPIIAGMGLPGLRLITSWLLAIVKIQSGGDGSRHRVRGGVWRPSIAPHAQNDGLHEISDSLIDGIRAVASSLASEDNFADVIRFLNGQREFILRRVGVDVATTAVEATGWADWLEPAYDLLMDPSLLDIDGRPEYVRLARALLPVLDEDRLNGWASFVTSNRWQGTEDELRRITAYPDRDPEELSAGEIEATARRFLYRLIAPLREQLPSELHEMADSMKAEFGEVEHPEFGTYMTSWSGPTAPRTRDEIREMPGPELISFLRAWRPGDDHHFGPSIEGLARELQAVIAEEPARYEAIAAELVSTGRSYVRAALQAWTECARTGYVPASDVWELAAWVAQQSDDGRSDSTMDFDTHDHAWRFAQRTAADLSLAYVQNAKRITIKGLSGAWQVLRELIDHSDPTPEHETQYGGSNMDPLTFSLNTTRPVAIRGAINLASRARRQPSKAAQSLAHDVMAALERHVGPSNDPSLATAAVFGEALGKLYDGFPDWLEGHREALLGALLSADDEQRAWSDVVFSVAVQCYRSGKAFINMLRPELMVALSETYASLPHTNGWRNRKSAVESTANHVVMSYVMKSIELSDPLMHALFASGISETLAAEAIGHLGWTIMREEIDGRGDELPPHVVQRARALVDWRVERILSDPSRAGELAQFFWWARCDAFPAAWWLPILALALESDDFEPHGMLGERLAIAAEGAPRQALLITRRLLVDTANFRGYDLLQNAPTIIAACLNSGDDSTAAEARSLLDELGRRGHMDVLIKFHALMEGERRTEAATGSA